MKKKVSYYYDEEVGNFFYGFHHPMKSQRIRLTHKLVIAYGLYKKMKIFRPLLIDKEEMRNFHSDAYVKFLKKINIENKQLLPKEIDCFNIDLDCPIFDGLWRFSQASVGGSLGCAYQLNQEMVDITINWTGGLHHAKKSEAGGFCYVNDAVLAILELLKRHKRVLYIDIDIHHVHTHKRKKKLHFHHSTILIY